MNAGALFPIKSKNRSRLGGDDRYTFDSSYVVFEPVRCNLNLHVALAIFLTLKMDAFALQMQLRTDGVPCSGGLLLWDTSGDCKFPPSYFAGS